MKTKHNYNLSLTSDVFVKFSLGGNDEDSKYLRKGIINELTGISYHFDTVLNPELNPATFLEKNMILDIHLKDDQHRDYNIEMQVSSLTRSHYMRFQIYLSRTLARQLQPGESYGNAKGVYQIVFLTKMPKGKKCLYETYTLKNEAGEESPYSLIHIIFVYLPYIHEIVKYKKLEELSIVEKFAYILETNLNHDILKVEDRVVKIMAKKKQIFLSNDELSEIAYRRQLFQKANEQDLEDAKEQGIEIGKEQGINIGEKNLITKYIFKKFNANISDWLETLNDGELAIVSNHFADIRSIDELKQLIR